jgi:hypothetical protein
LTGAASKNRDISKNGVANTLQVSLFLPELTVDALKVKNVDKRSVDPDRRCEEEFQRVQIHLKEMFMQVVRLVRYKRQAQAVEFCVINNK